MSDPVATTETQPADSPERLRRFWKRRWLVWSLPVALAGLFLYELGNVLVGANFRAVIPGQVYRSSQPSPARLERLVKTHGIRTVINLRGCGEPLEWYVNEAKSTHRLNLSQEDLTFSAGQLPSVHEVRKLIHVLERSERPVLIHCFRGVDRTGLASTAALLLLTNQTLDEALGQLSLRYGHLNVGGTGHIDEFFELYREWLAQRQFQHTRQRFRHWALHEYCPGGCRARFELVSPSAKKTVTAYAHEPFSIRVRAHNTSIRPWKLTPDETAGFHLYWNLYHTGNGWVGTDRAGLFHRIVKPGQSIDVVVQLPALSPGSYQLIVDMTEENHCAFQHVGGDVLELSVEVR